MKKIIISIIVLLFTAISVYAADYNITDAPTSFEVVDFIKGKTHPYLLGDDGDFDVLRGYLTTDKKFSDDFMLFKRKAKIDLKSCKNAVITTTDDYYTYAERQIIEFAFIYLMTGETEFADCAVSLMEKTLAVDWRESNTIETAAIAMSYAIGYDWLYDYMGDSAVRRAIEKGIWEKALKHAYGLYSGGEYGEMKSWAVACEHNWSLVCNAGFGAAVLAFLNASDSEKCGYIVSAGLDRVENALSRIGENGGWDEGVFYNQYGFLYFYKYIAMLIETTGEDFSLLSYTPRFNNIRFPMYMTGTSGKIFNNHDGSDSYPNMIQIMFAAKYRMQDYAAIREFTLRAAAKEPDMFDLLWYVPTSKEKKLSPDGFFDCYSSMRTSFDTNDGIYAAIHGGANNVNHGALDGGTFVLDALGERFVTSFGGASYSLPGYHDRTDGGMRWNYYRLRAEGANTLVINPGSGTDQKYNGRTTLSYSYLNGDNPSVTAEMTDAYPDAVSVKRTLSLTNERKNARLSDVINLKKESTVYWFMHTKADIEISEDGRNAALIQNGKRLNIKLISPPSAGFGEMAAEPLPESPDPAEQQGINNGYKKLYIELENVKNTAITVHFEPEYNEVTELCDNKSFSINEDFEDENKIINPDSDGGVRIGPFTGTVNTTSDYKEIEVADTGYLNRGMTIRFIKDTDAGVEKGGGVRLFSDNGTFCPKGTSVIDFNIKQRNVYDFKIEGRYASSRYTPLFIIRGGSAAYYDNGKYVELMPLGTDNNRVRIILVEETKALTLMINNKIVYKSTFSYPTGYEKKAVFRMTLTGGTEYVPGGKNLYTGEVHISDFNMYTTAAEFDGSVFLENTASDTLRVANFGEQDMDVNIFKASYEENTLLNARLEEAKVKSEGAEYINLKKEENEAVFVWDKIMKPILSKRK